MSCTALRMTVYLSNTDQFRRRPLYAEIVRRARAAGLARASVFRGCDGFGTSGRIRASRILSLWEELPALVIVVDRPDRIREFLPQVREVSPSGPNTLDKVQGGPKSPLCWS